MQKLLEGAADRPENGIYFRGQPEGRLLSWPYVAKNAMYYDSSEQALVPLTDAERAAQAQVPCLSVLVSVAAGRSAFPSCPSCRAGCPSMSDFAAVHVACMHW